MTSTNINQGLTEGSKPSSKVLRPPGGGSSDIFGTCGAAPVASPARARAPPSNNIFGGYEEPAAASGDKAKHNHMRSNVFTEPEPSPGSARKHSRTYESNVFDGDVDTNKNKSDDEKEKDKENGEEETENNNDTKSTAPVKAKGDNVYNPITGALNIGQTEEHPATETKTYVGKARDVSNPITGETKSFAIGGVGEKVNRPSTRVHHPPGGASTPLW